MIERKNPLLDTFVDAENGGESVDGAIRKLDKDLDHVINGLNGMAEEVKDLQEALGEAKGLNPEEYARKEELPQIVGGSGIEIGISGQEYRISARIPVVSAESNDPGLMSRSDKDVLEMLRNAGEASTAHLHNEGIHVPEGDLSQDVGKVMTFTEAGPEWQKGASGGGTGGVVSINGKMGEVDLQAEDVGAAKKAHSHEMTDILGLQGGSGGASGIKVTGETGGSTAGVTVNNFVKRSVAIGAGADPRQTSSIAIGDGASISNPNSSNTVGGIVIGALANQQSQMSTGVLIGYEACSDSAQGGVAIGHHTKLGEMSSWSVAIGDRSVADDIAVVSFGSGIYGDPCEKRRLIHVDAGLASTDAVNVLQMEHTVSVWSKTWRPQTTVTKGQIMYPKSSSSTLGFECIAAGKTGYDEPTGTVMKAVKDGTAVWCIFDVRFGRPEMDGNIVLKNWKVAPPGWKMAHGNSLGLYQELQTNYPMLYNFFQSLSYSERWNYIIDGNQWYMLEQETGGIGGIPYFGLVDDPIYYDEKQTLYLPDARDMYFRASGTHPAGAYHGDAIRNIAGSWTDTDSFYGTKYASGAVTVTTPGTATYAGVVSNTRNYPQYNFSAANVVPVASENRVKSIVYHPFVFVGCEGAKK